MLSENLAHDGQLIYLYAVFAGVTGAQHVA